MSDLVTRKLDVIENADPMGRGADDPWRDFRTVERLNMELHFQFNHSFGKLSPFFLALEERRLTGTRCTKCGKVWMPPRVHCGDDLSICEWEDLAQVGTLEAASLSAYTLTTGGGEDTLVLGYVTLDGADTAILQQVRNCEAPRRGMRVRAVWSDAPVEHPMQLFWFEPA